MLRHSMKVKTERNLGGLFNVGCHGLQYQRVEVQLFSVVRLELLLNFFCLCMLDFPGLWLERTVFVGTVFG